VISAADQAPTLLPVQPASRAPAPPERFRVLGHRQIDAIARRYGLPDELREPLRRLSLVLPFRVNEYVLSHLVDWSAVPADPVFQMVFPQPGMLGEQDERRLAELVDGGAPAAAIGAAVQDIRSRLNPHPSGQREYNVPRLDGAAIAGLQHKYRETVLYFPAQGQSCHAYCAYCFRWAQFVGDEDLRFAAPGPDRLIAYLRTRPDVSDVLVTGGDPLVMSTSRLRTHLLPLLDVDTVRTLRIGTKALAYWPQRFTTDQDADDLLRLFETVVASGRNLAVMAHFSHPREIEAAPARRALARIRATGALVYGQAPLIARVNDDAAVWADLWRAELAAGVVPYYLFVERNTGPYEYYKVPLTRALDIFQTAYRTLPGLARTVRGPVMSATAGKVVLDGLEQTPDGASFQLRFLQAREPSLVGRPFRARHHDSAGWLDELHLDPATPPDLARAVHEDPA
jgi:KamA family protein